MIDYKDFKFAKQSRKSTKRRNETDIPAKVKKKVLERDGGCCIICGKPGLPNAHYIKRGQGGLGIAKNVVTLCAECHLIQDNGMQSTEYTKK